MNNNPDFLTPDIVAQECNTLYSLVKEQEKENSKNKLPSKDIYGYGQYYGRTKYTTRSDEFCPNGMTIWEAPSTEDLKDPKKYYLHYPIVEEFALHRLHVLVTATQSIVGDEADLKNDLTVMAKAFRTKLQALASAYLELSLPLREKIQSPNGNAKGRASLIAEDQENFQRKSETIRWWLDKLHEDAVLLVAKKNLRTQSKENAERFEELEGDEKQLIPVEQVKREDLQEAAKTLHREELQSSNKMLEEDLLWVSKSGQWEFFGRHFHNEDLKHRCASPNSHDPQYKELPNYARVFFGTYQPDDDLTAIFTPSFESTRYASPLRPPHYHQKPPISRHLLRLKTIDLFEDALEEDSRYEPDKAPLHHFRTHLISGGGVASYYDHQGDIFEDSCVAAASLRHPNFRISYCCFGVNALRRGQDWLIALQNNIALIDLFEAASGQMKEYFSPLAPLIIREDRQYQDKMLLLRTTAQAYEQAIKANKIALETDTQEGKDRINGHLDTLYHQVQNIQKLIEPDAKNYVQKIRDYLLSTEFLDKLHELYETAWDAEKLPYDSDREYCQKMYYSLASLRLIFELSANQYGKNSWAHEDLNGLLQALTQIAAGRFGMHPSMGCRSANDRTLLVSLHLRELHRRMSDPNLRFKLELNEVRDLSESISYQYSQDPSLWQTVKDSGAPPKFVHGIDKNTFGLKELLNFSTFSRNQAYSRVMRGIRAKPDEFLGEYNFHPSTEPSTDLDQSEFNSKMPPKKLINLIMERQYTPENIRGALNTLLLSYPDLGTWRHTRQLSRDKVREIIGSSDPTDQNSIKNALKKLWIHYEGIQDQKSLMAQYIRVALIKLMSTCLNSQTKLDFPELMLTSKEKLREVLLSNGVLNRQDLLAQELLRPVLEAIDDRQTGFNFKFTSGDNFQKDYRVIEYGIKCIDSVLNNENADNAIAMFNHLKNG